MSAVAPQDMDNSTSLSTSSGATPQPDPSPRPVGAGADNNNLQGDDFVNVDVDMDEENNVGDPAQDPDDLKCDLTFSPYYHVARYTRPLRRAEVLGFVFVFLSITSLALQAQTGLEAVEFFVPTFGYEPMTPAGPHQARTFSWRILSDFFLADSVSYSERECLYLSKNRVVFRRRNSIEEGTQDGVQEISEAEAEETYSQLLLESKMAKMINSNFDEDNADKVNGEVNPNGTAVQRHRLICGKSRITDGWTWLCKYLINSFLPILNLVCSTLLFSCVRCRRRKGIQFTLMLPAFLAVFLGMFQQVPMIFTYSYSGIALADEMNEASIRGVPPMYLAPIWDETQYHGQCCGVHSAETWIVRRRGVDQDMYPPSCCNTEVHECNHKYAKRHEIYEKGCFKQEYERIKHYEFFSMLILMIKLLAEVGILWCLSDLTRYDYPRPEHQLNAKCDVRDFEVQTKGCSTIAGVTERQKVVVKLSNFHPRKYTLRTQNSVACKTINIRTEDGSHAGCVEIRRQRRNRNAENAGVDLDRGRQQGLIFISC